jgi:deazaflavin-dependent oxidoreductase (nitroreductase family)
VDNGSSWWQTVIMTLAATRPASWLLARVLPYLDRIVLDLTRNRQTATRVLTGLPALTITTRGARTGRMYQTPLLYLQEGENYILIATNFGQRENPGWYYNILAHPEIEVAIDGKTSKYFGTEVTGADWRVYWEMAVAHYPGYSKYQHQAADRRIPIIILTPLERTAEEDPR